jgi:hypothetical protein
MVILGMAESANCAQKCQEMREKRFEAKNVQKTTTDNQSITYSLILSGSSGGNPVQVRVLSRAPFMVYRKIAQIRRFVCGSDVRVIRI